MSLTSSTQSVLLEIAVTRSMVMLCAGVEQCVWIQAKYFSWMNSDEMKSDIGTATCYKHIY